MFMIINNIVIDFFQRIGSFLPNLLGGLLILIIGLLLGSIIKQILLSLFSFFRIETLFSKTKLADKRDVHIWEEVLTEILKWSIVVLFLVPTLEVWGLSRATTVLNQFLFYLPNVIIAVIIAFVGLVAANLGSDLVKHSVKTIGSSFATTLSVMTRWLTIFFTVLVVLNQLGVAQDLIRILFTGIVAMVALAGGLAFGLGGKDIAAEMLKELKDKFK
jgi:hypothetical protein